MGREILRRKSAEKELRASRGHYARLLAKSDAFQTKLRALSRQILRAHEDERKSISRELHDVVAQTLAGINLRLAALKRASATDSKNLQRNIDHTQKLVQKSVEIVHRFARELRPPVLDDLGLVPALRTFVDLFFRRTRIRVVLAPFPKVERMNEAHRTVLFRVAQEALTNVSRHAQATQVNIGIWETSAGVRMTIQDNGKSFDLEAALRRQGRKRLGLIGMQERMEMVGGKLGIQTSPGHGTTVVAEIPGTVRRDKPSSPSPRAKGGTKS